MPMEKSTIPFLNKQALTMKKLLCILLEMKKKNQPLHRERGQAIFYLYIKMKISNMTLFYL